jgi:acylphosphatase
MGRNSMHETQRAKRYFVSGMVQGVGYRFFAQRVADQMGIAGYVRNRRDGRVEVFAIASVTLHTVFRVELERGPDGAVVSGVVEEDAPLDENFTRGFSIESSA